MNYLYIVIPLVILLYFAVKELHALEDTGKKSEAEKFIAFAELNDDVVVAVLKQRPVTSRIVKARKKKSKVVSMECFYYDTDGKPVDEHFATDAVLKSYDKNGKMLRELKCKQINIVYLYKSLADFA